MPSGGEFSCFSTPTSRGIFIASTVSRLVKLHRDRIVIMKNIPNRGRHFAFTDGRDDVKRRSHGEVTHDVTGASSEFRTEHGEIDAKATEKSSEQGTDQTAKQPGANLGPSHKTSKMLRRSRIGKMWSILVLHGGINRHRPNQLRIFRRLQRLQSLLDPPQFQGRFA